MTDDLDLRAHDIQELASADALLALFARLGYDASVRLTQSVSAMGITAESLSREILNIELIASQDSGELQVYLVQLDSITIAATMALGRALRNRAGLFLLVLTSRGFDRLDFVLLERVAPEVSPSGLSVPQVVVRPRVLSVDRRKPGAVELRVLRRFTYTEADAYAQYDKLLSAYAVARWSEPLFNNRALFSDHVLNTRLRDMPGWREDPKPAYQALRALYLDARARCSGLSGADVRRQIIGPTLSLLGFTLEQQPGGARPDYLLRASGASSPVACQAYTWGRLLDGKDETRDRDHPAENPGAQVVTLLEAGAAPWAIVTNGKLWRLYAASAHSRATNYYEIDLEETLALDDPGEAFRYFWLLFRARAFAPVETAFAGTRQTLPFVEVLRQESAEYARALGDRLKDRVFEEVFPQLAAGFIAHIRHVEGSSTELDQTRLDQVFRGTLTLLYRLLFLLYAEARDLLPVRDSHGYWEKSLSRGKLEIAERAGALRDESNRRLAAAYSKAPTAVGLYDRLRSLAEIVDRGDSRSNTPTYHGELFMTEVEPDARGPEAEVARFLQRFKVPDRFLATAIDRLARDLDPKRGDLMPMDYKSLGVRQLGWIYEGLLQFRLRLATEKMAVVRGKRTEEIVPYRIATAKNLKTLTEGGRRNGAERTLPAGAVYIENDRRERKATGSYYTPDYIVEYIVDHAVGPVLREHLERLRPRFREAQLAHRQAVQRLAGFQKRGMRGDDPEKVANEPRWRELVNELFEFRVVDPSMGSGHFLVEAVDFITDRVLDFLNGFPWNPVQAQLRATRETILTEMERQEVIVDDGQLTDVNLLKRHVLKRCIFGVDLNPMAVELAKVSLWLDCFTLGAPLSFLDHHLKAGNSLIGTTVQAVERGLAAERQGFAADLFGGPFTGLLESTALVRELASMPDASIEQARHSHSLFEQFERAQAPYKQILDLWISHWFQNKRAREYLMGVATDFIKDFESGGAELDEQYQEALARATDLRTGQSIFHWDLEFPEVFVDTQRGDWRAPESQGFHAVIGNPPWIRQETIGVAKPSLKALHPGVYDSVADTYVYFVGRGLEMTRRGGRLGMVLPNKWLRADYGRQLRTLLASEYEPLELVDFGHAPVFPEADTFPCIFVAANTGTPEPGDSMRYCQVPRTELADLELEQFVERRAYEVPTALLRPDGWITEPPSVARLLDKIRCSHPRLCDTEGFSLFRGIISGLTEAFIVDQPTRDRLVQEDPGCEPLLRKVLRGRNIERWHPDWDGEWLILLKSGTDHIWAWTNAGAEAERVFQTTYPSLYRHMKPMQDDLLRRQDQGCHWWELRSCSYYDLFERPKIVYQEILFHSWFAWDDAGYFHNNKAYSLRTDERHLAAILNSSVLWWYMARALPHMKDEAFAMQSFAVEQLPVPRASCQRCDDLDPLVPQLVTLAADRQRIQRAFLARLRSPVELERPSAKLQDFWRLSDGELAAELKRAVGSRAMGVDNGLGRELCDLAHEYRLRYRESLELEFRIQRLVFDLYGLTPEEVALVRETAPPRDPLKLAEANYALVSRLLSERR
ncbi:MAG: Eco57I restriction-modification methylase domain-containing protein [Chloroflexi bacterium]|nr:Eco57I restriction-modification methylase domain-containing protein [Chloroflexota bacterium]